MVLQNKLNIYAYKSKYNLKRKNQVVLLILTDGKKKWHYLAVKKKIPALCRGITSKHKGDFHSYSTEQKLKKHEKVCKNYDYCYR